MAMQLKKETISKLQDCLTKVAKIHCKLGDQAKKTSIIIKVGDEVIENII